MDKKQYNNIIEHTLNHEATGSADFLERARAIFKNMGVALPSGSLSEVAETLRTDDFMGWKACSMKEAQDAANEGTAAIGVSEERIVILAAADEEAKAEETDSVMTLSESTPALSVSDMQFYSYSYGDTTADNSNKDYRGKIFFPVNS